MLIYIFLVSSLLVHFVSYILLAWFIVPLVCRHLVLNCLLWIWCIVCNCAVWVWFVILITYFMDSLLPKETLGVTWTRGILGGREPFISGKHTLGEDTNANTLCSCCWFRLSIIFSSTLTLNDCGATCLSIFPLSDHSFDFGSWTTTWLPGWNFSKTFWLGNFTSCLFRFCSFLQKILLRLPRSRHEI